MMHPAGHTGGRGGGTRGRGRGGRGGGGFGDAGRRRGGMVRTLASAVPPPPITPCDDPKYLPFPRLMAKNERGTMTLDEELLRAIIGQYTVMGVGSMHFGALYDKLKQEYPELMWGVYNSKEHFWAYLRCYTEHFEVDFDPRFPWHVRNRAESKIVAKADRHRYNREFNAGNIKRIVDPNIAWNNVYYDVNMEKRAVTRFFAVYYQLNKYYGQNVKQLDLKKLASIAQPAFGFGEDLCNYIGDGDAFLHKRVHFFNIFGHQVDIRDANYYNAIRKLTEFLAQNGRKYSLSGLFENVHNNGLLTVQGCAAVRLDENFSVEEFLTLLYQHQLLFDLRPRNDLVILRHDVVPQFSTADVERIEPMGGLDTVITQVDPAAVQRVNEEAAAATEKEAYDDDSECVPEEFYDAGVFWTSGLYAQPSGPPAARANPNQPTVQPTVRPTVQPTMQPTVQPTTSPVADRGEVDYSVTLAALKAFSMNTTNVNENHTNQYGATSQMVGNGVQTMPTATEPAATAPRRRFVFRVGARPPRASVRCRPAPSTGRLPPVGRGVNGGLRELGSVVQQRVGDAMRTRSFGENTSLNAAAATQDTLLQTLEDELPDYD